MSASEDLDGHVREINRCNQRGGRMLSIVDLLEAGTVELPLAAYLLSRISKGASFLVGATPGGAGKTVVMCALLGCVPPGGRLVPAADISVLRHLSGRGSGSSACLVCHEIGAGPYYAYLWGEGARLFFRLTQDGYQIATNLHADTLEECRDQLCGENGVAPEDFRGVNLQIFLRMSGRWGNVKRSVATVWESLGAEEHRCLYDAGSRSPWVGMDPEDAALGFYLDVLEDLRRGRPDIRSVRRRTVELLGRLEAV